MKLYLFTLVFNCFHKINIMVRHITIGICGILAVCELCEFIHKKFIISPIKFQDITEYITKGKYEFEGNNVIYIDHKYNVQHGYIYSYVEHVITKPVIVDDIFRTLNDNENPEITGNIRKLILVKDKQRISDTERDVTKTFEQFENLLFGVIPYKSHSTYRKIVIN